MVNDRALPPCNAQYTVSTPIPATLIHARTHAMYIYFIFFSSGPLIYYLGCLDQHTESVDDPKKCSFLTTANSATKARWSAESLVVVCACVRGWVGRWGEGRSLFRFITYTGPAHPFSHSLSVTLLLGGLLLVFVSAVGTIVLETAFSQHESHAGN